VRQPTRQPQQVEAAEYETASYEQNFRTTSCGPECGCPDCYAADCELGGCDQCYDDCCDDCCETVGCGSVCAAAGGCYAGFEATFLKPHYQDNPGVMENVQSTFTGENRNEVFTDDFSFDTEFAPRIFAGWENCCGVGVRVTWWDFGGDGTVDPISPVAVATPVTSASVATPTFGGFSALGTGSSLDTLTTATWLDAYTIDIEGTKSTTFCCWDLGVSCGLRYAEIEQSTTASLSNATIDPAAQLSYRQSLDGIGPTLALSAHRPIGAQIGVFGKARGSILFGDGESQLQSTSFGTGGASNNTTFLQTNRDDVLSILELQIGCMWKGDPGAYSTFVPFATVALEGQLWQGAGNASSEDGSMGFFGLNSGMGVRW